MASESLLLLAIGARHHSPLACAAIFEIRRPPLLGLLRVSNSAQNVKVHVRISCSLSLITKLSVFADRELSDAKGINVIIWQQLQL